MVAPTQTGGGERAGDTRRGVLSVVDGHIRKHHNQESHICACPIFLRHIERAEGAPRVNRKTAHFNPPPSQLVQSTERAESLSGRTRKAGAMVRSRAEVWLKSDWAEVTGGASAPPEAVQEGALSPHLKAPCSLLSAQRFAANPLRRTAASEWRWSGRV